MANVIPSVDDFLNTYPQFAGDMYATAVATNLAMSINLLSRDIWGDLYSEGVMLDTAHNTLLEMKAQEQGGMGAMQMAVGSVSSVSAAGISTSFNSSSANKTHTDDWYNKTIYGQKFLRLRALVAPLGILTA